MMRVARYMILALVIVVVGNTWGLNDSNVWRGQTVENQSLSHFLQDLTLHAERSQVKAQSLVEDFRGVGTNTIREIKSLISATALGVANMVTSLQANLLANPLNGVTESISGESSHSLVCGAYLIKHWWSVRVLSIHDWDSFKLSGQTFELTGC